MVMFVLISSQSFKAEEEMFGAINEKKKMDSMMSGWVSSNFKGINLHQLNCPNFNLPTNLFINGVHSISIHSTV